MKPNRTAALSLFLLVAMNGCGDDEAVAPEPGPFSGTIHVVDNRFEPASVTISAGDSVTWRFEGSAAHTVTEGATLGNPSPLFDSGLRTSGSFGFRFQAAGTYPYHCIPHFGQGMKGTVTVE